MGFKPEPAEGALVLGHGVAQHRLTIADPQKGLIDRLVWLEENGLSGVVPDDFLAALEHHVERLLHRLSRCLLDELVHHRVARRLLLGQRHGMRARELRAGPDGQRGREAPVVFAEPDPPAAQQDETADAVADRHGHRHRIHDSDVLGQVVEEAFQGAVAGRRKRRARFDGCEQRPGPIRLARHGQGVQPLEADARGLRHELVQVPRGQVAARDVRSDLAGDVGGQGGHIVGRRRVDLGGRGQEGAVLLLQLARLALDGVGKPCIRDPAGRAARAEHDQPRALQQKVALPRVELGDEERQHQRPGAGRHRDPPGPVHHAAGQGDQPGQAGQGRRPADPPAGVE